MDLSLLTKTLKTALKVPSLRKLHKVGLLVPNLSDYKKTIHQGKSSVKLATLQGSNMSARVISIKIIVKLSPSQPANPQLCAEIALISVGFWATHHPPTPY